MLKLTRLIQGLGSAEAAPGAAADRGHWTAEDWARVRAPARDRDRTLSAKAQRWLCRFPPGMRPHELPKRFPRIVNRLATLWRDEGLTEVVLLDLMTDTRGGRQGFPPAILAELETLYEVHRARFDAPVLQQLWTVPTQC